jgi:hypothetical protein
MPQVQGVHAPSRLGPLRVALTEHDHNQHLTCTARTPAVLHSCMHVQHCQMSPCSLCHVGKLSVLYVSQDCRRLRRYPAQTPNLLALARQPANWFAPPAGSNTHLGMRECVAVAVRADGDGGLGAGGWGVLLR